MGEIFIDITDKEQANLVEYLKKYIWPIKKDDQASKNKMPLVTFLCKAFIFLQQSSRIPISNNFFVGQKKSNKNNYLIALPTLNSLANKLTVECLIQTINQLSDKNQLSNNNEKTEKIFINLKNKLDQIGSTGQNYYYLINAALELKIPILSFESQLTKFGIGNNQIYMNSTITEDTPFMGVHLVQDKFKTSRILKSIGLPGTLSFKVKNSEEAIAIANKINYPVVIKPADLDRGLGVFAQLINDQMVKASFEEASKLSKNIIVEKHYEGFGHRLTFFKGKVLKVTKKLPMGILGDGRKTIEELIKQANNKKEKNHEGTTSHSIKIVVNDEALSLLKQFNLTTKSVPEIGKFIPLRRKNNSSAGGSNELIPLKKIHSDNLLLCIRAAELFKLDIAGIDLIIQDIGISWLQQPCAICEINAMPQTDEITIKKMLLELMHKMHETELHLGITLESKLELLDEKIRLLSAKLGCNGYNSSKGLVINNQIITKPFLSTFYASKALAQQRDLKKGLVVVTLEEIRRMGLPLNHFSTIEFIGDSNKKILQDQEWSDFVNSIKLHADKLIFDSARNE